MILQSEVGTAVCVTIGGSTKDECVRISARWSDLCSQGAYQEKPRLCTPDVLTSLPSTSYHLSYMGFIFLQKKIRGPQLNYFFSIARINLLSKQKQPI